MTPMASPKALRLAYFALRLNSPRTMGATLVPNNSMARMI